MSTIEQIAEITDARSEIAAWDERATIDALVAEVLA